MTITLRIEGLDSLKAQLGNLDTRMDEAIQDGIVETILKVDAYIKDQISQPGLGLTYQLTNPNRTHRASAPGHPPATDTGALLRSIQFTPEPKGASVGSRIVYARYLEYGTTKMAARPVWRPAAEKAADWLPAAIRANLARIL